jgi:hypothetical protein
MQARETVSGNFQIWANKEVIGLISPTAGKYEVIDFRYDSVTMTDNFSQALMLFVE